MIDAGSVFTDRGIACVCVSAGTLVQQTVLYEASILVAAFSFVPLECGTEEQRQHFKRKQLTAR